MSELEPAPPKPANQRPDSITAFCVLVGVWGCLQIVGQLISPNLNVPELLDRLVILVGFVGLWWMKRWGACILVASLLYNANQPHNNSHLLNSLLLAIILSIIWNHAEKMD